MRPSLSLSPADFTHTSHLASGEMRYCMMPSLKMKSSAFHGSFFAVGFASSASTVCIDRTTPKPAMVTPARNRIAVKNGPRIVVILDFVRPQFGRCRKNLEKRMNEPPQSIVELTPIGNRVG